MPAARIVAVLMRARVLSASVCLAGSLVTGPACAGQTAVYGTIDAFAGSIRNQAPGAPAVSRTVVDAGGMENSFLGLAGAEDLGGGLKAVYQIETFLRNDTGNAGRSATDAFWARNAAVGFEGRFGRSTFGRNVTPYYVALLAFNPLADSFVFGPMMTHSFRGALAGDIGMSNSIRLQSGGSGPWRTDLLWSAGEERGIQPDRKRGRAFDWAIHYRSGPFATSLARRSIDLSGTISPGDGRDQKAWLLGASYALGQATLFAQYQDIADSGAGPASEVDVRTWQLGTSALLGPGKLLASWANSKIDDADPFSSRRRDTWTLGYDYLLSKRTDLYAVLYRDALKEPAGPKERVVAVGMRHRF